MFVYNFNKIITINCLQTIKILYLHFLGNAKDTPNRSASHKYIIRSFVNVGADVELARSRPAYGAFAPSDFFMEVRKCLLALLAIVMISYYVRSCKWY